MDAFYLSEAADTVIPNLLPVFSGFWNITFSVFFLPHCYIIFVLFQTVFNLQILFINKFLSPMVLNTFKS